MRILLRLCRAQILVLQFGENLHQDVLQFFRRQHVLQPRPRLFVLRHRHVKKILRPLFIHKLVEVWLRQGLRHLPRAVGAEIVENYRVLASNGSVRLSGCSITLRHHNRLHKFIGDALLVALLQRGHRIARLGLRFSVHQRAVGHFHAFPAVVAVHRVIPPHERCDFTYAQFAHLLL